MKRYFSYDPNGSGFKLHDTAAEARQEAEAGFAEEKRLAAKGWWPDTESICWGEVKQGVVEKERRAAADAERSFTRGGEYIQYNLETIPTLQ